MNLVPFALQVLIAALQMTIKNPKSLAKERKSLVVARDLIDQVLSGIPEQRKRK